MDKQRLIHFDLLRIVAAFAVVFLHVATIHWGKWAAADVTSFNWIVMNFYASLARWCVPIFIMISGCFFLNPEKEISIKDIYKKNILRIAITFAFWSPFYALIMTLFYWDSGINHIDFFIRRTILGHSHLWFLYTIAALYMVVPFLRQVVKNRKLMIYFIILNFIFGMFLPTIVSGVSFFKFEFEQLADKINLHLILGYTGYFVAGYYLNYHSISKSKQKMIYSLSVLGILLTIGLTTYTSLQSKSPNDEFHKYLTPNCALIAVGIFVFFKEKISKIHFSEKTLSLINKLSAYSFGIYLVHVLFIMLSLSIVKISPKTFNPIFSVPIISILIFAISTIVVHLISKVSLLKKYII